MAKQEPFWETMKPVLTTESDGQTFEEFYACLIYDDEGEHWEYASVIKSDGDGEILSVTHFSKGTVEII